MNKKTWSLLFEQAPLFKNVSIISKEYVLQHAKTYSLKKGESFISDESVLVFILKGSINVFGKSNNNSVILNTLDRGSLFGMASLFGEKCDTTRIVAKQDSLFAILLQDDVEVLMQNDMVFTRNYVQILSDKIRFLNQKIAYFTSGSTEKKIATYLFSLPIVNNQFTVKISFSKLASMLDMGRASLYRALDALEQQGLFERKGNVFTITSLERFEKMMEEKT